jgi:hypothetical protein
MINESQRNTTSARQVGRQLLPQSYNRKVWDGLKKSPSMAESKMLFMICRVLRCCQVAEAVEHTQMQRDPLVP